MLDVEEHSYQKLAKIISSLVLSKESLTDWNKEIVYLALILSFEINSILLYIVETISSRPVDVVIWYYKAFLQTCSERAQHWRTERQEEIRKLSVYVGGKLTEEENEELSYRLNLIYSHN